MYATFDSDPQRPLRAFSHIDTTRDDAKSRHGCTCLSLCGGCAYDLFTVIVSLLDVATDILVLIGFYNSGRMLFFWLSLSILIVAQFSYIIAFYLFHGRKDDFLMGICLLCCTLPISPCLSFLFYFASDEHSCINQHILQHLCCLEPNDISINKENTTPLQRWMKEKLHKHAGFVMETLFEAFPQSILQLIAIIYHDDDYNSFTGYVSIISIFISMLSVFTKSFILSVAASINWKNAIFNWMCCITDFLGIFFMVSIAFYVPAEDEMHVVDESAFAVIRQIWMYKIIVFILPFALVGSIAMNVMVTYDLTMQGRWGPCIVDVVLTLLVQCAWAVGLCLTVMSMEIACFVWMILLLSKVGLKSRIPTDSGAHNHRFYMDLIAWIRNTNGNQLRLIKTCVANKMLLQSNGYPMLHHVKRTQESEFKTAMEMYADQVLDEIPWDDMKKNRKWVSWTDIRNHTHNNGNSLFLEKFYRKYTSIYEGSQGTEDCWQFSLGALTFLLGPWYFLSRILTVLFPLFVWLYLYMAYGLVLWYGNIQLFQFVMFAVYVVSIAMLVLLFVFGGVMTEQFYGWHILPSYDSLQTIRDSRHTFGVIERRYREIVDMPLVRELVSIKFGTDIAEIIMFYYLHIKDTWC